MRTRWPGYRDFAPSYCSISGEETAASVIGARASGPRLITVLARRAGKLGWAGRVSGNLFPAEERWPPSGTSNRTGGHQLPCSGRGGLPPECQPRVRPGEVSLSDSSDQLCQLMPHFTNKSIYFRGLGGRGSGRKSVLARS